MGAWTSFIILQNILLCLLNAESRICLWLRRRRQALTMIDFEDNDYEVIVEYEKATVQGFEP